MAYLFYKRHTILVAVLILLFSFACTSDSGDSEDLPNSPTETKVVIESTPYPQEVTIEQELVFGHGEFIFTNPQEGLANLSSYKATLTLSFEGTQDGNPETWSATYVILSTAQPAARSITVDSANGAESARLIELEMDDTQYKKSGEKKCVANSIIDGQNFDEPASFLRGVIGAEEAGSESINNIATNHYAFDQGALGEEGITESQGELWVASEGGYLVKYLLTTKADADYFGEGIEGTATWDYQINEINSIASIDLPEDCPAALPKNLPLMQDASNVQDFFGVMIYETASMPKDVIAFYQEQMPSIGWTEQDNQSIGAIPGLPEIPGMPDIPNMPDLSNLPGLPGASSGSDTQGYLTFTQGKKSITITAEAGETNTEVRIIVSNGQ